MNELSLQSKVSTFRKFNRFHTKLIGLLNQGLLKTPYSLTQARILFEISQNEKCPISEITKKLNIDPGLMSRILTGLEKNDLIQKTPSKRDARQRLVRLKKKGRKAFDILNNRASTEIELLLKKISIEDQMKVINAMHTIQNAFEPEPETCSFFLRNHQIGDIGWIIFRHGTLYAEEYNFNRNFEILVAKILYHFYEKNDLEKERLWIAERNGERVASVMITDSGDEIAQLRLLLVEPKARGRGLGKRLINECLIFSRQKDYKKIKLFTVNILKEAHHLYSKAGFKIIEEKPHSHFGRKLTSQIWELIL